MMIKFIFILISVFLFLFIFWKKLKEDYLPVQIFNTAFLILIGLSATSFLSNRFFSGINFWFALIGIIVGLLIGIFRYRLRVFETVEAAVIALFPLMGLTFLSDAIASSSSLSLMAAIIVLLLIGFYVFLDSHYKRFSWYRSGRVGFSGLTVLGIFFLIRGFVAVASFNVLSFAMPYEGELSLVAAFITFLITYNLARQKS